MFCLTSNKLFPSKRPFWYPLFRHGSIDEFPQCFMVQFCHDSPCFMGVSSEEPQDFRLVNHPQMEVDFPQRKPSSVFGVPSIYLVGGLEHDFSFPFHIWDNPNPIDFHIFQRGRSTTNQLWKAPNLTGDSSTWQASCAEGHSDRCTHVTWNQIHIAQGYSH